MGCFSLKKNLLKKHSIKDSIFCLECYFMEKRVLFPMEEKEKVFLFQ